jgi:hypothetical protein
MAKKKEQQLVQDQVRETEQAAAEGALNNGQPEQEHPRENIGQPEQEQPREKPGQTDAAEQALKALGTDATNTQIKEWCQNELGYTEEDWGTSFYNARKAALKRLGVVVEDGGKARPAKKTEPTISDLLKVKAEVAKFGSVEEVAKQVREIEALASVVGGLAVLKVCLEALEKSGK